MPFDITFKSIDQDGKMFLVNYEYKGAPTSRKIPSWTSAGKKIANILNNAASGEVFSVTSAKNEQGFSEWTDVERKGGNTSQGGVSFPASGGGKGTYETHEERARRQVYIIRQSSLTNACSILASKAEPFGTDEAIAVAEVLADWVLNTNEEE